MNKSGDKKIYTQCQIYFDGGARGNGTNHAKAGCGAVLKDDKGNTILKRKFYMGLATNNEAEYMGLLIGIQMAIDGKYDIVTINGDSSLVINQMGPKKWKINKPQLLRLANHIRSMISKANFHRIEYNFVRREFNKEADSLANQAMDDKAPVLNSELQNIYK